MEPETWQWYFSEVGRGRAALLDAWWQTETGGILCTTAPGVDPMKPGSAGPGVLGIFPEVRDEEGQVIPPGTGRAGALVIPHPWPGQMAGIWGDPERYIDTYFRRFNSDPESTDWHHWPYVTGDGAVQAADGYIRILGRLDDVINVAGHRLGAKEIESACLAVPEVAEAAVVPVSDPVKGRCPEVYIALRPGVDPSVELADRVTQAVETTIGKIARPTRVWFVPDMPKTRSGKILRRVLAAISNHRAPGDLTTLANPEVVAEIERLVRASGDSPSRPAR
jgi:acetyl-CoA synthetase